MTFGVTGPLHWGLMSNGTGLRRCGHARHGEVGSSRAVGATAMRSKDGEGAECWQHDFNCIKRERKVNRDDGLNVTGL